MRCLTLFACLSLYVASAAQNQAPSAEEQKKLCRLEGHVVSATTGQALPRARVRLSGRSHSSTLADAEGHFVFGDLQPGSYSVIAEKIGYLDPDFRAGLSGHPGIGMPLTAGQEIKDLELTLVPQAVISGRVLDPDGEPVGDRASVRLLKESKRRGHWDSENEETANDLGEYRFAQLRPGKYFVLARGSPVRFAQLGPGGDVPEEGTAITFYPNAPDRASAAPIEVGAGQEVAGIEITLRKSRLYRIEGKLAGLGVDDSARDIMVTLGPRESDQMGFGGAFGGRARADGSFEITGVAPGSYSLTIMQRGPDPRPQIRGRIPVDVAGENIRDLVVPIFEPLRVTGTLLVEGDGKVALDQIRVGLRSGEGRSGSLAGIQKDGSFTLDSVAPDLYSLSVQVPMGAYLKSARAGKQDVLDTGLDAREAHGTVTLELVLGTKTGTIEGTVTEETKPVRGGVILVTPDPFSPGRRFMTNRGTLNDDGHFRIEGLAPGSYNLYAWRDVPETDLFLAPDALVKGLESKAVKVTVIEGATANADLKLLKDEDSAPQ